MLSGETAVGKYPIETVAADASIVKEAEADFDYRALLRTKLAARLPRHLLFRLLGRCQNCL